MSKESAKVVVRHSGIGFFPLLALALIVLKLTGMAKVTWLAIAAVFFAPLLIIVAVLGVVGFFAAFAFLVTWAVESRVKRRK
jgi:hypothetical protein